MNEQVIVSKMHTECLCKTYQGGQSLNAIKDGNHIRIYDAFLIKESIKEIPGRFYDSDDKAWLVPLSPENAATLALLGVELEKNLISAPETDDELEKDEKPIVPMPIKAKPYQHQVRAYNFALRRFGIGGAT